MSASATSLLERAEPIDVARPGPEDAPSRRASEPGAPRDPAAPLLVPGRNCWALEHADRAAFLVDADAYFAAFAAACERAERAIYVLGWDVNSKVKLRRSQQDAADDSRFELARFLDALARRERHLQVHLLAWDYTMIYALERELLPVYRFGIRTHRRVHFDLDAAHPFAASQHQKVVVVDDRVAFVGGLDLTACRWDTPAHRPDEPLRHDEGFAAHGPFHDVQMLVEGAAAARLGELARERIRRATGRRLSAPRVPRDADRWPPGVEADVHDVPVAIARTLPQHDGRPSVREVEALFVDGIRAARRHLYVENQYLTADAIGAALVESLRAPEGPEVVIVGPRVCSGWLEQGTLGALRTRLVGRLLEADHAGRLHLYWPDVAGLAPRTVTVHSKVLVADDRLLKIGSANASNRSMGLDSECDLALEGTDARSRRAITRFRDRLLAEHLGRDPAEVGAAIAATGSMVRAIEELRSAERWLERFECGPATPSSEVMLPVSVVADPSEPIDVEAVTERWLVGADEAHPERRHARALSATVTVAALASLWRYTPIASSALGPGSGGSVLSLGGLAAAGAFAVAAFARLPVSLLTLFTVVVLGLRAGVVIAIAGATLAALGGYAFGQKLPAHRVPWPTGRALAELRERLGRRPTPRSIANARLTPRIPFATLSVVAGASRIPLGRYVAGTLLAIVPLVLAVGLFAAIAAAVIDHGTWALAGRSALALVFVGAVWLGLRGLVSGGRGTSRRER